MSYTLLRWTVADPAALRSAGYDSMVIEREEVGPTWVPVSRDTTFIPVVVGMYDYIFHDPNGDAAKAYRYVPKNRTTGALDSPVSISNKENAEPYVTVAEMQAEGFPNPPFTPALLARGLAEARAFIERQTRNFFEPRYRVLRLDGRRSAGGEYGLNLLLPAPVCAVMEVEVNDSLVERDAFVTYNRHLTADARQPSDPGNPRICFKTDEYWGTGYPFAVDSWRVGSLRVLIRGIFGWTELGYADEVGETVHDSGIPLSYGSTPALIKRVCMKLAAKFAHSIYVVTEGGSGGGGSAGPIIEEKTRDQSYKRQGVSEAALGDGVTSDPEIDAILESYRAPILLGSV